MLAHSILRDLNPRQREAVEHCTGPLLVIAGPGTGKTRVITEKVRYLVPTEMGEIEVDVFEGELAGMITAEMEFDSERRGCGC